MARVGWTRQQLLVAFNLYCQLPFGKLHARNPDVIRYAELINRTPGALAMKLVNIASLDPVITSTGRKGLVGASNRDREMWEEMQNDWENFAVESQNEIALITNSGVSDVFAGFSSEDKVDYTGFDRETITKERIGQSFFRQSVLSAYNNKCCITGLSIPKLLVASHIVPWREDPSQRLNPRNGLSLSVLHDKAFDQGIITILEDMTIRVADVDSNQNDHFYQSAIKSYDKQPIALPEKFTPHQDFLDYHRNEVFKG